MAAKVSQSEAAFARASYYAYSETLGGYRPGVLTVFRDADRSNLIAFGVDAATLASALHGRRLRDVNVSTVYRVPIADAAHGRLVLARLRAKCRAIRIIEAIDNE